MIPNSLKSVLNGLVDQVVAAPPLATIRLFKTAVYGILLLNTIFLIPISEDLWGTQSLILPLDYPSTPLYHLYFILMNNWAANYYPAVMAVQAGAILGWFLSKGQRMMGVLIYLSTAMLFTSAHLYVAGGHTLMKILLFYMMLIPDRPKSSLGNAMANLFLLACKVQLAIVYGFAAIFKLHGTYWTNGEALYYVMNIREFSHPVLQELLLTHPAVLKVGTWIGFGYQLLFPILVWFRWTKIPLLLVGIFFHLFIGFGMGLPDFGLFMVMCYTMFINDHRAQNWLRLVNWPVHSLQRG